jgi:hypothetical protein
MEVRFFFPFNILDRRVIYTQVKIILLKVLEFPCRCKQSFCFGDTSNFWKNVVLVWIQEAHDVAVSLFDLLSKLNLLDCLASCKFQGFEVIDNMFSFISFFIVLFLVLGDRPEGHIFVLGVPTHILGFLVILLFLWKGPFSM